MTVQETLRVQSANEVFVRRARKLMIAKSATNVPVEVHYVGRFVKNLQSVGFTASKELIGECVKLSLDELTVVNNEAMSALKTMVGAHREFKPMYPNFPEQVVNMSNARLYFNAFVHYWSGGKWMPSSEKLERPPLANESKFRLISLGSKEEFESIFTNLASANTSISQEDKNDIAWFARNYGDDLLRLLPPAMPHREVKACVSAALIRYTSDGEKYIEQYCGTATDVLRVAVALSGGDVSLAEPCKFGVIRRRERKALLAALESMDNRLEDMLRWQGRWVRLGERLHPGEYWKEFPKTAETFKVLRNDLPAETFNRVLEREIENKNAGRVAELLAARPGDFARRLDHCLRLSDRHHEVIAEFSKVADRVSTPVLLQVKEHFLHRKDLDVRVFFPKGEVSKAQAVKNNLPDLPEALCRQVAEICTIALSKRFATLPPLGKCYLDEELKNFTVPFSQRSASKSLRTAARGSRMELPPGDTLRLFVWWKNDKHRTDLDLSAAMFSEDMDFVTAITFYNIKDFGGHHSGDIVDAPKGASEFIDVSRANCLKRGVRYVVIVVLSYTQQPYCDLPECFAGWMSREKPNSGEVYEPRTVQDKLDITANSKIAVPAIFDLKEGRVIWTDMSLSRWPFWYNTVAANVWGLQSTLRTFVHLSKPNLYDLLKLHIDARGQLVERREDADVSFSVADGTPFDLARIASQFL